MQLLVSESEKPPQDQQAKKEKPFNLLTHLGIVVGLTFVFLWMLIRGDKGR